MKPLIILALITLLSAFVGSLLAGYLKRNGKNLATREDVDNLADQLAAIISRPSQAETTPISNDKLYEEIGRAWQYFDSWREKIFAGYLSVLAALAFALSKSSIPVRAVLFAFSILASIVFWILDFRTAELINCCQAAGENLAGSRGLHRSLNRLRFTTKSWLSYGTAINLLVSSVAATGVVGLAVYLRRWRSGADTIQWWLSVVAIVLAALFCWVLRCCADKQWSREKAQHRSRMRRFIKARIVKADPGKLGTA